MKKSLSNRFALGAVLLALLFGGGIGATWYYHPRVVFGVGDIVYADTVSTLNSSATLPATVGSVEKTDFAEFFPAAIACRSDAATMLIVRVAANDWAIARTAAGAETFNFFCTLNLDTQRTTALKGIKITSIALVYQITVVNLTS